MCSSDYRELRESRLEMEVSPALDHNPVESVVNAGRTLSDLTERIIFELQETLIL
jgi:hypothetical protein